MWPRSHLSVDLRELGWRTDCWLRSRKPSPSTRWPQCIPPGVGTVVDTLGVVAWLKAGEDLSDASPRDRSRNNGPLSLLPTIGSCRLPNAIICTHRWDVHGVRR